MNYITVNANVDAHVTNVKAYAVCFNTDPGIGKSGEIQQLVYNNRGQPSAKHSIVELVDGQCNLLQMYNDISGSSLLNIDTSKPVYIVTIANDGSTALNGTMKTTNVI